MYLSNKSQKGFTLVETLVAVFIITTALAAAFTAAHSSLKSSNRARDQVVAFYLTQEGFELIKNLRDSNFQDKNKPWLAGLGSCVNGVCRVSPFDIPTQVYSCGADCPPLKYDSTTGRYQYSVGEDTSFVRNITITESDIDEIKVDIVIKWTQGGESLSFETTEFISNWRGDDIN